MSMHVRRAPDGSVSERPRLAAGQAPPGPHSPSVTVPDLMRVPVAPYAAQWPYQSFLELGALPGAVPCARLHARHVLWEWGLAAFCDSAELVLSELATNAVQASRAMRDAAIRVWLVSDRAQIVVFVWDASPRPPARADLGEDAENGRGLLLVEAVSESWGHFPGGAAGKVVWAVVPPPDVLGTGASP
jgi:Histidine kinase-like ATPase domain